jgi:hypothetical protein
LVLNVKGRTDIQGVSEDDAEENMWTYEERCNWGTQKITYKELNNFYSSPYILGRSDQGG